MDTMQCRWFSSPSIYSIITPKFTTNKTCCVRYPMPFVSKSCNFQSPSFISSGVSSSYYRKKNRSSSSSFPAVSALVLQNEDCDNEEAPYSQPLPCQLYVCNLPTGCDISQLLHIFNPFGTVQSVEVSRDAKTGLSRGCGYVTMSSIDEAKATIFALDGSDVGGRELRVMFAVDVDNGRRNVDALNSTPKKDLVYESPYKLYAGNLIWAIKPEDLRNLFSQFGTVVSVRVVQDRKAGKNRVYAFLSFSLPIELEAAMALNGTDFCGRKLILREVRED